MHPLLCVLLHAAQITILGPCLNNSKASTKPRTRESSPLDHTSREMSAVNRVHEIQNSKFRCSFHNTFNNRVDNDKLSKYSYYPNPGPAIKYPCPICARNVTSRGVSYQCNRCSGWVHAKCSGLLNAAQYRRSSDWACDPCLTPTPSPPPTPTPPTDKKVMTAGSTAQCKWNW